MNIVRIFFQIIVGALFGVATAASLTPLLVSFAPNVGAIGGIGVFFGTLTAVTLAPNTRRAFGRSFLLLGAAVFLLPISTLVLSGVAMNETIEATAEVDKGYAAAGGMLAGGVMTAFAGFFGFIIGSVLLFTGLILSLGGRREVVIVEHKSKAARKEPRI